MVPPALLTTMSSRPNSSTACATRSATTSLSLTSDGITRARRPRPRTSSATASSCSFVRAASTMSAPASANVRAIAAPMPRPAPVTIAVFPSSRNAVRVASRRLMRDTARRCRRSRPASRTRRLDRDPGDGLDAARHFLGLDDLAATPELGTDRHRRREADLLGSVVDAHRDAVHLHQLGEEVTGERHREVAVGDRRAERALLGPLDVGWIHWWSRVASANLSIWSWVIVIGSVVPRSVPTADSSAAGFSKTVVMRL